MNKTIIAAIAATAIFASCSDYLDVDPKDKKILQRTSTRQRHR